MSGKSTNNLKQEQEQEQELKTINEFLEKTPPNQYVYISNMLIWNDYYQGGHMNTPEIRLHCDNSKCNGTRFFRCRNKDKVYFDETAQIKFFYLKYRCSNCQQMEKTFSLAGKITEPNSKVLGGECCKLGELPQFGPPVPSKLIKLIGPDRETFLNGRRCENQGLGIGSFIYYRRVVENQKNRILNQVIKVSKTVGASQDIISTLERAVEEVQFSKALEMAKDAMPESLYIKGHSPISLLHNVLSEGVHALTDEECLQDAIVIRVVLGELSERLSQALKDNAEVNQALSSLMNKKRVKG